MNNFYTNAQTIGSKIYYRGYNNGKPIKTKIDYRPTLFLPSKEKTKYTTMYGEYVSPIRPGTIRDCRNFIKQYEDVESFTIYGFDRYEYAFISDEFPDQIDFDMGMINVANIDIEVGSEFGFPEANLADHPITAITIKSRGKFTVISTVEFKNDREDVNYIKCIDEIDLIKKFLSFWSGDYPDIVTGWNILSFDIPYLVNRIRKLLGENESNRLSPWNIIHSKRVDFGMNRDFEAYTLLGIATLDYLDMYQRYAPDGKTQSSYKLDSIANHELGTGKLDYEEYGNLHTLWKENPQLFVEYNLRDVELIDQLDSKLKLIEMVCTLAYDAKCNYEDAFAQVRMWDVIVFNELKSLNMVVPPRSRHHKTEKYEGAFVKPPQIGMHEWVASYDLDSLYIHLMMQYNISPETLVSKDMINDRIAELEKYLES